MFKISIIIKFCRNTSFNILNTSTNTTKYIKQLKLITSHQIIYVDKKKKSCDFFK